MHRKAHQEIVTSTVYSLRSDACLIIVEDGNSIYSTSESGVVSHGALTSVDTILSTHLMI